MWVNPKNWALFVGIPIISLNKYRGGVEEILRYFGRNFRQPEVKTISFLIVLLPTIRIQWNILVTRKSFQIYETNIKICQQKMKLKIRLNDLVVFMNHYHVRNNSPSCFISAFSTNVLIESKYENLTNFSTQYLLEILSR